MISVIIPSVRDYRWKDILNEFSVTKTEFEIIVCGPCPPQDLGPNFRCIQTNVKTVQCIEIAIRQSKGEYLFFTTDDTVPTPGLLDVLLDCRLSCKEDLVIVSPSFSQLGKPFSIEANRFPSPTGRCGPDTPLIPTGTLISRKDWNTIGGIDRHFVRGFWDIDVSMRCWEKGGKTIVLPDVFLDEILPNLPQTSSANVYSSYHQDMPYLLSVWTDGAVGHTPGQLRSTRLKPVEPFVDEGIMEVDQGVPEAKKAVCQHYDAVLAEYIRTGKSPGCRDLR